MGKKAAPESSSLTGKRIEDLAHSAHSIVELAFGFSLEGQEGFTVGSVLTTAPEMVGQWRKGRGTGDPFAEVSRTALQVMTALDKLENVLSTYQGSAAPTTAAAAPLTVSSPGGPQSPLPAKMLHTSLALVPVRRRATGNSSLAPAAQQGPDISLTWRLQPGWTTLCALLHTWLGDAWDSTYKLRQFYWALAFVALKVLPTLLLWGILLAGVVIVAAFLANPVHFARNLIRWLFSYLAALPRVGWEVVQQLSTDLILDMTGKAVGVQGHCLDDGLSHSSDPQSHQTPLPTTPASNTFGGLTGPANPPPRSPTESAAPLLWACIAALVGWTARGKP